MYLFPVMFVLGDNMIDICQHVKRITILECPNCKNEFESPTNDKLITRVSNREHTFFISPCPICDQLVAIDVREKNKC
jgi:hypothetical protein